MEKFLLDHRASFEAEKENIRQEHIKRCEDAIARGSSAEEIATPEQSKNFAYGLVAQTIGYFEKFNWVAKVSIPECDATISRKRAERTVEAALDILKLFFRRSGKYLRQGHSLGTTPKTARLTREADGKFDFSLSWGAEDALTNKEWLQELMEAGGPYLRAAGEALDTCVDPQCSSHLKERFLDAMAWYGQAVSEPQPSVQIIKYVAALERLTVTGRFEEGLLTATVIRRSAFLSCHGTNETYERMLKETEQVYDCRSDLMHGSKSPFDKRLDLVVPLSEKIARNALFGSLALYTGLEHDIHKQATAKNLEEKFKILGV